jgi:hypothetical protein
VLQSALHDTRLGGLLRATNVATYMRISM